MQRMTPAPRTVSASERVIEAVADREGVDPMDLDVPLFESVDPDVLDLVVRSADGGTHRSTVRVSFSYYGYEVSVAADGSVDVAVRQ